MIDRWIDDAIDQEKKIFFFKDETKKKVYCNYIKIDRQ